MKEIFDSYYLKESVSCIKDNLRIFFVVAHVPKSRLYSCPLKVAMAIRFMPKGSISPCFCCAF